MIEVAQDEIYAPSDTSLVPKRGWITLFEDVHDAAFRVQREPPLPPQQENRQGFLGWRSHIPNLVRIDVSG